MTRHTDDEDGLEWVRRDIAGRGAKIAYLALVDVAQDKKAPSPARATAGVAIMRAAGLQDSKSVSRDVEPAEMSPEEMNKGLKALRAEIARLEKRDKPASSVRNALVAEDLTDSDLFS